MSYKSALSNSIKSNCEPPPWIKSQSSTESNVKLAGDEAKDRLYEPKHKKKLVRVLTVVAYIFSVSLAAIMLSLYYIFIWNPQSKAKIASDGSLNKASRFCPELMNQEALAQIKADVSLEPSITPPTDNVEPLESDSWQQVSSTEDTIETFYEGVALSEMKTNDENAIINYDNSEQIVSNETAYK